MCYGEEGENRSNYPSNYLTKTDEAKAIRKDENQKGRKQRGKSLNGSPEELRKRKPTGCCRKRPFQRKKKEKKDQNIHTKNTHSPPACYSVVDPH